VHEYLLGEDAAPVQGPLELADIEDPCDGIAVAKHLSMCVELTSDYVAQPQVVPSPR
jgi:hypothetical protein